MELMNTLVSDLGAPWNMKYSESEHLTHIGGFLMTYGKQCRVTLSTHLSKEEKVFGLKHLLACLAETPPGSASVHLWSTVKE